MLATVIQKRSPNFNSLISPLLVNKDLTVIGDADQAALLQGTEKHARLLDGLLVFLKPGICLGKLALELLLPLLVLLLVILVLRDKVL